jgi:uncharacterized protein YoxC
MAKMTADEILAKYKKNMGNAVEDIKRGVRTTDKNQAEAAKRAIPKMKTKLIEAIDNGKVERGLDKSGHAGWQAGMLGKGVNNILPGISAKEDKIRVQMGKVADIGDAVHQATKDMSNNNLEEGIQKVRVAAEMQQEFWKNQ